MQLLRAHFGRFQCCDEIVLVWQQFYLSAQHHVQEKRLTLECARAVRPSTAQNFHFSKISIGGFDVPGGLEHHGQLDGIRQQVGLCRPFLVCCTAVAMLDCCRRQR